VRLAVTKTAKNRRVQTNGASSVTVRYRVYGREMSVRNNFIDADFALLNGAATFLSLVGDTAPRPHEVVVSCPPPGRHRSRRCRRRRAATPITISRPTSTRSSIPPSSPATRRDAVHRPGQPHVLVNVGEGGVWDGRKSVADVQKVVETVAAFWGTIPAIGTSSSTSSRRRAAPSSTRRRAR
jgi:predicted metalloprotease with PDZ domain